MDDKKYPTRDEIEKADDRPWKDVPVPELGPDCMVRVGVMSAPLLLSWDAARKDVPREEYPGLLVARAAVDPNTGGRLFGDEDAAWLNTKNWQWIARVYQAAAELNGLTETSVETATKN